MSIHERPTRDRQLARSGRCERLRSWSTCGSWSVRELGIAAMLLLVVSACATRMPPPLPAALKYPEFVSPTVPPALKTSDAAVSLDRGWRFLQNDDLGSAAREFARALRQDRRFYPARA